MTQTVNNKRPVLKHRSFLILVRALRHVRIVLKDGALFSSFPKEENREVGEKRIPGASQEVVDILTLGKISYNLNRICKQVFFHCTRSSNLSKLSFNYSLVKVRFESTY